MADGLLCAPLIGTPGRVGEARYEKCVPDNQTLPKGARTWNIVFERDMRAGAGRCMVACRLFGEEVGNHFHIKAPNKDPEKFVVLAGFIDVHLEDVYGDGRIIYIRVTPEEGPALVTIPPYVLHRFEVRSAKALFIEFQEGPFDPQVTFPAEAFGSLCASLATRV